MIVWGWLFIGLVSLVSFRYALSTTQDELAIVTALVSMAGWFLFGWQALNVEVVTSGITTTYQYPGVTFFGVGMGIVMLYVVLTGPIALIGEQVRRERREEMVR